MAVWSIKSRIVISSVVVFGIVLSSFAVLVYQSSNRSELAKLDARLDGYCDKLGTELEEQFSEGQFPNWNDLRSIRIEGLPDARFEIRDTAGAIIYADSIIGPMTSTKWQGASIGDTVRSILRSSHISYRYRRIAVEIEAGGRIILEVVTPMHAVHENLEHLRTLFMTTIPVALLIMALAAYFITRSAFRPLTAMAKAAEDIEATDLSKRLVLPKAKDEVHSLGSTLNLMLARIDIAFRSQRQFVADASHELRTPLTVIIAELEFALKHINDPETRKSIDISLTESDRLSRLVEGLLLLARTDASQLATSATTFRADELVVDVVHSLHRQAELKQIQVTPYIQEAVELQGQGEMIRRALFNVLENAIKYSPSNSDISIELEESESTVTITTTDHGPGIGESEQGRLFERFFRGEKARAETDGSGLGLAIAKKLIELNGGSITLYSSLGVGTSVLITLPRRASK